MGAWLLANPRLILAGVCAAALLGLLGWERHQGAESVRKADRVADAKIVAKAADATSGLAQAATDAGTEAKAAHDRIVYRTRTVIERIPYEVPPSADPVLGVGWVRSYADSLALPADPGLAARAADDPYLHASEALAGVEANNDACLVLADHYARLVKLYDEARTTVNGFHP